MIKKIGEDHFTMVTSEEVRLLCQPLFENTDIVFFQHVRSFPDDTHFVLSTDSDFALFLYDNNIARPDRGVDGERLLSDGWFLAEELIGSIIPQALIDQLRLKFNLDHYMLRVVHQESFSDLYVFAAPPEKRFVKNFYLNNIDLMERFLNYFERKARHLYELSSDVNNRFMIRVENTYGSVAPCVIDQQKRHDFIQQVAGNSNIIKDGKEIALTLREKECLMHLSKGKSIKETAAILGLSPRTISVHFKNIKDKLNCYSKSAIIELFRAQTFYHEE